jgi:hypothetical protein
VRRGPICKVGEIGGLATSSERPFPHIGYGRRISTGLPLRFLRRGAIERALCPPSGRKAVVSGPLVVCCAQIVLVRRDRHRVSKSAAEKLLEDLGRQLSTLDRAKARLIETRLTARIEACRKAGVIVTEAALRAIVAQLFDDLQRKRIISAETRKRLLGRRRR